MAGTSPPCGQSSAARACATDQPGFGKWLALPESQPDRLQNAGQQDRKQPEPVIEVALVPVAEPDVVIEAVSRRYLPSLRQVLIPRPVVEDAEHLRGRGRQPPDDRVLDGSHPLPSLVVQQLAKPETRPEHARPGLGAAPELDDEP